MLCYNLQLSNILKIISRIIFSHEVYTLKQFELLHKTNCLTILRLKSNKIQKN